MPACGAATGTDVSLSDKWAVVTCQECLCCRPSGGLVSGGSLVLFSTCLALFGGWVGATQGWPMGLFPTVSFGSFAVVLAVFGLLRCATSLRDWGVEPAEPREKCDQCGKPGPVSLSAFFDYFDEVCNECEEAERRRTRSSSLDDGVTAEPRWAHLLNRTDVVVLDVSTFGSLDTNAEVRDAAVIDTHGNVLLHDLWAQARRAQPPGQLLRRPGYHDVLGPVMRVLQNASVICVYNAEFDIPLIQRQVARHGRDPDLDAEIVCIKEEYAAHYTPDRTWLTLEEAARRESVLDEVGEPHPPLNDVRLTLGIMCKVVARERRARGLVGDARAPNYSGTSLVEDDIPF